MSYSYRDDYRLANAPCGCQFDPNGALAVHALGCETHDDVITAVRGQRWVSSEIIERVVRFWLEIKLADRWPLRVTTPQIITVVGAGITLAWPHLKLRFDPAGDTYVRDEVDGTVCIGDLPRPDLALAVFSGINTGTFTAAMMDERSA